MLITKNSFRELVRSGKVKQPTQRGFKKKIWDEVWEISEKNASERSIYEAGLVFYETMNEIRAELEKLYTESMPRISNEELLRYYFAIANRDRTVSSRAANNLGGQARNVFSMTLKNNIAGNSLTLMEIGDGCVDGVAKAIEFCAERIAKRTILRTGKAPSNHIDFTRQEAYLSQIYGICEAYWAAVLWGDYDFSWVDKAKKVVKIQQNLSDYEVAHDVSHIRRMRLSAHSIQDANSLVGMINDKYVVTTGAGKKRSYKASSIEKADEKTQFFNASFNLAVDKIYGYYSEHVLEKKYLLNKLSVVDLLEVFRVISLLALNFQENFPANTAINSAGQLQEYAPSLDYIELVKAVADATGLTFSAASSALEFMRYKGQGDDIWCHPLFITKGRKILLLTAAFITPNILRVVEHWLVKLDIELATKGLVYEGNIIRDLNAAVSSCQFCDDYDEARSTNIKLNGVEEEIDLIFRVRSTLLVGEAKSVVTTDSPISYFRTRQILTKAAQQARRKADFVERNLHAVIARLGFKSTGHDRFTVLPLVLNSNKMCVGFSINNVPICDEATLVVWTRGIMYPCVAGRSSRPDTFCVHCSNPTLHWQLDDPGTAQPSPYYPPDP